MTESKSTINHSSFLNRKHWARKEVITHYPERPARVVDNGQEKVQKNDDSAWARKAFVLVSAASKMSHDH